MGTTSKTSQQSQFDPGAMQQYQGMQGGLGKTINSYMTNPFGNPFMQTQQQMGTRQAQNMGGTQMSGLLQNMTNSGMQGGASSPAGLEMQQNQARANTGQQANLGFLAPMQNALGMQQNAMGLAENYRPLQTGQNQTQSTGGLGTWLPQLMGAAVGGLTGMGGLGSLFGGGGGGGGQYAGAGMMPSAPQAQMFNTNYDPMGGGFAGAMPGGMGQSSFNPYMMGGGGMPPPPMPGM
jgi:hypothetical protein